jgi:hypothetical protein
METTTIEKSFSSSIAELYAIFIYNFEVLHQDPATQNCFVPPEKIDQRQAITLIVKNFSDRKTTIPKPRTASGPSAKKPKAKLPTTAPLPEVQVNYQKAVLNAPDMTEEDVEDLAGVLPEWLDMSETVVRRALANSRCVGRFVLYTVPIDANRTATVCAYKKNRLNYALAVMCTDVEGNSEWLTSSANSTYRIVQNHAITIPHLTFPTAALTASLRKEIEDF